MLRFIAIAHGVNPQAGLSVSFDDASRRLARLPRMYLEPDGSFVWTGTAESGTAWQLDGNLIDRGLQLDYVELKGTCPPAQFDEMLTALGWPAAPLLFQLPQRGVFLEEAQFRRLAESEGGAS
jgi:hypothetical protein